MRANGALLSRPGSGTPARWATRLAPSSGRRWSRARWRSSWPRPSWPAPASWPVRGWKGPWGGCGAVGMGHWGWGNGGRQQGCCQAHQALCDRLCLSVHPSERLNIQFVSAQSRTGLLTAQEAQHVQQLHEENRRFLRIPRRWVMLGWGLAEVVAPVWALSAWGRCIVTPVLWGGAVTWPSTQRTFQTFYAQQTER